MQAERCTGSDSPHTETPTTSSEKDQSCESTTFEDESELLKSRLDEQIQLIMILKKSTEDTDAKCKRLKEENQKLASIRDTEEENLAEQTRKLARLADRLKTLQLNYEELTALVQEFQNKDEELTKEKASVKVENDRLFLLAKSEANKQIEALTNIHNDLKKQCATREKDISDEKRSIELKKSKYRHSIAFQKEMHKQEVKNLMDNLVEKKAALEENKEDFEKEEAQLYMELPIPEEVLKLEVKHTSLRKNATKKQSALFLEKKKTENLLTSIRGLEEKEKELSRKFEQLSAEADAEEDIKDIKCKIIEAQLQLKQTQEEMAKYKMEAQQKLQQERELNEKLRHIH